MRLELYVASFTLITVVTILLLHSRKLAKRETVERYLAIEDPGAGLKRKREVSRKEELSSFTKSIKRLSHLYISLAAGMIVLLISGSLAGLISALPLCWLIPKVAKKLKRARERKRLRQQLLDFLDCTIQSLEGGFSLLQSLEFASGELDPPLAPELAKTLGEVHLGKDLDSALSNLGDRLDDPDLRTILSSLLLLKQSGGNLPQMLRKLRRLIQERLEIQRELEVYTVQGRLSGYVVSSLPIVFLLIESVFSRKLVRPLFSTPPGISILAMGLLLETLGFLWIKKISRLGVEVPWKN
jgi:tight adherence protein B